MCKLLLTKYIVNGECFSAEKFNYNSGKQIFVFPSLGLLSPLSHLGAAGLGLCLSCLFYVDQNVSAALVNAPENRSVKVSKKWFVSKRSIQSENSTKKLQVNKSFYAFWYN